MTPNIRQDLVGSVYASPHVEPGRADYEFGRTDRICGGGVCAASTGIRDGGSTVRPLIDWVWKPMAAHTMPPPLRDGDQLTSDEFLRRWEAMPDLKHAELIDGIVYMPSPVSSPRSVFHFTLSYWLAAYEASTPGCQGGMEGTWLMGERNVPQPDTTLRILPAKGGQSRDEGDYTAGAPELIVEVAVSSSSRDLGVKLKLYERMGVQEYLVAVTGKEKLIWHVLTPSGYQLLEAGDDGIMRSHCFPGLRLDTAALWARDKAQLNAVLQRGLATPEHAAFVARLGDVTNAH